MSGVKGLGKLTAATDLFLGFFSLNSLRNSSLTIKKTDQTAASKPRIINKRGKKTKQNQATSIYDPTYMKTKKALGALLGLLGSLPAFPFLPLAGFSAPLLFTASLKATRRGRKKKSQNHVAAHGNRMFRTENLRADLSGADRRTRESDSYLASALAAPFDLAPFMTDSCRDTKGSGQIRARRSE